MYQQWLKHLFEHEETQGDWRFRENSFNATQTEIVELITRMLNDYEDGYKRYSDWQIGMGIYYVFSNNCSDYSFSIKDDSVPIEVRLKCIDSIKYLFRDCFESRCKPVLSHLNEEGNELNSTCYILWDTTPLSYCEGSKHEKELYDSIANVMAYSLSLKNIACIESGLHGLGHLVGYFSKSQKIIEKFIASNPKLPRALIDYAKIAKTGCIQ